MTVYVDDMKAAFGRMTMCHMLADTTEELLQMASKIGVQRKWLQHGGTFKEHFDIALSKRALAVENGAKEITWRQSSFMIACRRVGLPLGDPYAAEARYRAARLSGAPTFSASYEKVKRGCMDY